MAFNALISGSECGPSNALQQVTKQLDVDRSLQKDRIGGPGAPSGLYHLPTTSSQGPSATDQALTREFFDGARPQAFSPIPGRAFDPAMLQNSAPPQMPDGRMLEHAWGRGVVARGPGPMAAGGASSWGQEFQKQGMAPQISAGPTEIQSPGILQAQQGMGMNMNMHMPMQPFVPYAPQMVASPQVGWDAQFARVAGDTKGKGREIDQLEEAFNRASLAASELQKEQEIKTADGENASKTDDMTDMERVWKSIRESDKLGSAEEMARWEAENAQLLDSQRDELDGLNDFDYAKDLEEAWKQMNHEEFEGRKDMYFDNDGIPQLGAYQFERENPYLADTKTSHLNAAKDLLASPTPSLTHAALMLEAAIQQNDLGAEGYEAWVLLGEVQSMDEKEESGLLALRESFRRAELTGNGKFESELSGRMLMSLAISYTNESYDQASQSTLRTWLRSRYEALIPPSALEIKPTAGPWALHMQTTEAYLAIARQLHAAGQTDPDVQVGLGVLYYMNAEYDKAADCFQSALSTRPEDYLLWNRLGSCLSNGSKPEEALGIYREALRLRPTYTRAIYNVGVACLNIGAHKEATEHFLSALALHRGADPVKNGSTKSEQLWQTLRRTLLAMNRPDLADLTSTGDVDVYRAHGFDF